MKEMVLQNSPYERSVLSNKKARISGAIYRPVLRAFRYKLNAVIIISLYSIEYTFKNTFI